MKKTIILLGFVLALLQPLAAQDTVHIRDMRLINRYFVPEEWPDEFETCIDSNGEKKVHGYLLAMGENFSQLKQIAFYMETDDTLQVYGIAACLSTRWRLEPELYVDRIQAGYDTSCEYLYDYLRLYEADPDSLRHIGEELLVHMNYTPVSYYINLDLYKYGCNYDIPNPILPMYERYFSAPVTVTDSFYVGKRYRTEHMNESRPVTLVYLSDTLHRGITREAYYCDYIGHAYDSDWNQYDTLIRGWHYDVWTVMREKVPFLFPILTPAPDTTDNTVDQGDTIVTGEVILHPGNTIVITPGSTLIVGGDTVVNTGDTLVVNLGDTVTIGGVTIVINSGDTLVVDPGGFLIVGPDGSIVIGPGSTVVVGGATRVGLGQTDMLYRYTAVQPNPATGKVRVTSSFGLTQIDVYDTKGRLLHSLPATGLKADLDVSSWPRGTYLLRILTPAGPTTKKLLVQ